MVDIHSHILPKTDDGAATFLESLDMLRLARAKGTKKIVCTPHFYNPRTGFFSKEKTLTRFEELKQRSMELDIELFLGCEVFCSDPFLRQIKDKEFFTINGTDYLLVEFDFHDDVDRVFFALDIIIEAGYIPIVAHPERYNFLRRDEYYVQKLLSKGALLQLNASSLAGLHGEHTARFACELLNQRLASIVASDAHDTVFRTTDLRSSFSWIYSRFSKQYAEELFFDNPEAVLTGQKINTRW